MDYEIEKLLTFEIKKELAERYFGFRKLIEEDKERLEKKIKAHSITIEQQICFSLIRVFILLKDDELIQDFLNLNGLEKEKFYDPYLTESPTIQKTVFQGVKMRGFTKARRFKNLLMDTYMTLVELVRKYLEKTEELREDHETISEEIKLFYKKHDISSIMCFLRSLDCQTVSNLEGAITPGFSEIMEKKLAVKPPQPIEQCLTIITPLPPPGSINKQIKKLIARAYKLHKKKILPAPVT